MKRDLLRIAGLLAVLVAARPASADDPASWVPALSPIPNTSPSEMRDVVARFTADHDALTRRYDAPGSPDRLAALRGFTRAWQTKLGTIDFGPLSVEGRLDWILLQNRLRHDLRLLDREEKRLAEMAPLMPFAGTILGLADARRRLEPVNPQAAAQALSEVARQIENTQKAVEAGLPPDPAKAGRCRPPRRPTRAP